MQQQTRTRHRAYLTVDQDVLGDGGQCTVEILQEELVHELGVHGRPEPVWQLVAGQPPVWHTTLPYRHDHDDHGQICDAAEKALNGAGWGVYRLDDEDEWWDGDDDEWWEPVPSGYIARVDPKAMP